jgi:hypothetical protein
MTMRVVTRTFLLALVALALVPSGARAQTSVAKAEQSCLKERLIAIGKAAQCQSAAEGKYIASNLKEGLRGFVWVDCVKLRRARVAAAWS